ncbi:hypothetical protein Clacol_002003 [Clathrus columnatus]|uniref:Uncharacterized protein n=1 Tax=Clathrus columnatus TaxID=1419009 RepID=A0AAV5A557_9AGAM|nr:hypothetical protein Clacol_002003 [Clathrus columnatus]
MPQVISISENSEDHKIAALALSNCLDKLNLKHHDIDVLVESENLDFLTLRQEITRMNRHFATAGVQFYFVKNIDLLEEDPDEEQLVYSSKDNVLIEMLRTGSLGLPHVAGPIYPIYDGSAIKISQAHYSLDVDDHDGRPGTTYAETVADPTNFKDTKWIAIIVLESVQIERKSVV